MPIWLFQSQQSGFVMGFWLITFSLVQVQDSFHVEYFPSGGDFSI